MTMFVNTMDKFGDDETAAMIIERTITEYCDDTAEKVGPYAFYECTELTEVNVPNVTEIGESGFYGCTKLANIDLINIQKLGKSVFQNCKALTEIKLTNVSRLEHLAFCSCSNLVKADIGKAATEGQEIFRYCTSLKTLILRIDYVNPFRYMLISGTQIAAGAGYIYVPRALVESYKAATNWSEYADRFRALEDYTVDGTVDGELDETKI
jgi:hypothetical protein